MKHRHVTRCIPFKGSWGWEVQIGGLVVLWKCWDWRWFWDPYWSYLGKKQRRWLK